jgi:penicillin-binding protein 1A
MIVAVIVAPRRTVLPAVLLALVLAAASCSYETPEISVPIPELAQSTSIYDRNGTRITTLVAPENRTVAAEIEDVPERVRHAVIAIEDERFYLHSGIDLRALARAARSNLSAGGISEGGSTITQQYVKIAVLQNTEQTAARKMEEFWTARRLEEQYGKDFILLQYLNTVYFGSGAYGVTAAAQEYFSKDLDDLTVAEAAMLAGLIQAPSRWDPFNNYAGAVRRSRLVLDRMLANGFINAEEYETARTQPPVLRPYVPRTDVQYPAAHFVDEVKAWFLDNPAFGETRADRERLLFAGGLRIETTIDLALQAEAEAAVEAVIPANRGLPDAAVVTLDPSNGQVLAMVGGRDFWGTSDFAKVNLAAGKGRQAGSSMKPFGLAAFLADGESVLTSYRAPSSIEIPLADGQIWRVKGGGGGSANLIVAMRRSMNTVFAQLMMDIGPERFVEMATEMGITTDLSPVPAAILGTEDVTMLDMAAAYGVFANRGNRVRPSVVTKVRNPDGTVLWEHRVDKQRVLSPGVADQMNWVLTGVIEGGTGTKARLEGRTAAGKTGTAQNFADAAFVGYTPQRVTAVWVGFPEGQIPMVPPATPVRVAGGEYPAQIWKLVMEAAHAGIGPTEFAQPPPSSTTTTVPPPPAALRVPDVVGRSLDDARAALTAMGFGVSSAGVETDQYAPGTVMVQSPPPGSFLLQGSSVTLEFATAVTAPTRVTVPNVTGLPVSQARQQLASLGFGLDIIYVTNPDNPAGTPDLVWQQSPGAGTSLGVGEIVTIRVNP